jgi:hypothetical protein
MKRDQTGELRREIKQENLKNKSTSKRYVRRGGKDERGTSECKGSARALSCAADSCSLGTLEDW